MKHHFQIGVSNIKLFRATRVCIEFVSISETDKHPYIAIECNAFNFNLKKKKRENKTITTKSSFCEASNFQYPEREREREEIRVNSLLPYFILTRNQINRGICEYYSYTIRLIRPGVQICTFKSNGAGFLFEGQ